MVGSSPLARGLPGGTPPSSKSTRIIPARAGFTTPGAGTRQTGGDHPRSRGVYSAFRDPMVTIRGSSPLARGLQEAAKASMKRSRIIPARAGFTTAARVKTGRDAGSSPLARGLHVARGRPRGRQGIIPARAGFTAQGTSPRVREADHPRSRGVYQALDVMTDMAVGSSPLARGLLNVVHGRRGKSRIIPARAGFTFSLLPPQVYA